MLAGPSQNITQPFGIGSPHTYLPGIPFSVSWQFALDQTDLFAFDRLGQVGVFSVLENGRWQSSNLLGLAGFARPGSAVAASQHFGGNNQTDVFVVGTNGQLNVFSAIGSGQWNGLHSIGPAGLARSGAALVVSQRYGLNDQTDV